MAIYGEPGGSRPYVNPIFGEAVQSEPGYARFHRESDGMESELTDEMIVKMAEAMVKAGAITANIADEIVKAMGQMQVFNGAMWDYTESRLPTLQPGPNEALNTILTFIKQERDPDKRLALVGEWLTKITNRLTDLTREEDPDGA